MIAEPEMNCKCYCQVLTEKVFNDQVTGFQMVMTTGHTSKLCITYFTYVFG